MTNSAMNDRPTAAATDNAAHVSLAAMGHYPAATEHDGSARALREFLTLAPSAR